MEKIIETEAGFLKVNRSDKNLAKKRGLKTLKSGKKEETLLKALQSRKD